MIRIVRYENDCTFNNSLSDYDPPNYEEQKQAMSQVRKMKRWLRTHMKGCYNFTKEDVLHDGMRVRLGNEKDLFFFDLTFSDRIIK